MTVYVLKKKKGRVYSSAACVNALAQEFGFALPPLEHDAAGAPFFARESSEKTLFISISDTKNYWACALSEDSALGLDIEEARKPGAAAVRALHPLEQQYLGGLGQGSSEWNEEFLQIWTRKESYMKFCGEGLRIGLASFSVLDGSLAYAASAEAKDHPEGFICGFSSGGLTGALCAASPVEDVELQFFSFEGNMPKPALEKATDLLADSDYLSAALSKKLQAQGYSKEESEAAVTELQQRRYLDDARVCASYVRRAAEAGKGSARIRTELLQKGASKADVDAALAEFKEEDESSEDVRARAAVSSMRCESEKDLARIGRKLASLGYAPHIIYDILAELRQNKRD